MGAGAEKLRRALRTLGLFAGMGVAGGVAAIVLARAVSFIGGTCVLCDNGLAGTAGVLAGLVAAGMQASSR